nr:tripartite motif-containing protein 30A-like [Setaria viridis]
MAYDEAAVVRRSTIAPCVTCGLCGSILRDATTVSECLHSFCRKCISEKFEDEDNKHCPTCNADLGWDPKLREFENVRAQMADACERTRILEERHQREFEMSQSTARILERIDAFIGRGQDLEAENARLREELGNERADKAAAFQRIRVLEGRLQIESETGQKVEDAMSKLLRDYQDLELQISNSERIMQWFDAYINQNQVYKEVARLKDLNHRELENARSEKTVAFERAKILEERLEEQTEQLQTESKKSQESEAARREVLREYRALKYEMTEKNEELSNLKHNIKRSIEVEQRNAVLEDQIDHANSLFEAEKLNTRKLDEQLGEVINEKNKLMTELETYNDGLARIQECI